MAGSFCENKFCDRRDDMYCCASSESCPTQDKFRTASVPTSYLYDSLSDFKKLWREVANPITGEKPLWRDLSDDDIWNAARAKAPAQAKGEA